MSLITIKDLVVQGRHGVTQAEKAQPQPFGISLELTVDLSAAALSDNLNDTVNYSMARQAVIDVVQNQSFNLIERLAQAIGEAVLDQDKRIQKVLISVDKLEIFASGVPGVRLEVSRPA